MDAALDAPVGDTGAMVLDQFNLQVIQRVDILKPMLHDAE